jgi:hypothetical protein
MNMQFASKARASVSLLNPNFKVYQVSFQAYKRNEDRTVVLETSYGLIAGVFDGTHNLFRHAAVKYE